MMAETSKPEEAGLTKAQYAMLEAPLDPAVVSQRSQGGRSLSYIEGHYAIRRANEVFGYDGWTRQTLSMRCVVDQEYAGKGGKKGQLVAYIAEVQVTLHLGPTEWRTTTGHGYGEGIDYNNPGQAHESAVKEAETDAMKRALIKFGDQFGLSLYGNDPRRTQQDRAQDDNAPREAQEPPQGEETVGDGGTWGETRAAAYKAYCREKDVPDEAWGARLQLWGVDRLEDLPMSVRNPVTDTPGEDV